MKQESKTKYEILYGVPVDYFPNEEENVRDKLRLATSQLINFEQNNPEYTYENQCIIHEYNNAISWCRKILEDINS